MMLHGREKEPARGAINFADENVSSLDLGPVMIVSKEKLDAAINLLPIGMLQFEIEKVPCPNRPVWIDVNVSQRN